MRERRDGDDTAGKDVEQLQGRLAALEDAESRRAQAEQRLATRLRYEAGLARCSRTLLRNTDGALTRALEHLRAASNACRIYIFENADDPERGLCMSQTHEVCAPDVHPEIDNPLLQRCPYEPCAARWAKSLSRGVPIAGPVHSFPDIEQSYLDPQEILSVLVLPITVNERWWGFVGFDDTRTPREWTREDVRLLRIGAEMIGCYIERKRSAEELRRSRERFATAFHSSSALMSVSSLQDGRIVEVNDAFLETMGYQRGDMIGRTADELGVWKDYARRTPLRNTLADGRSVRNAEVELVTRDGAVRRCLVSADTVHLQDQACVLAVLNDVTDLRRAEAERRRLESVMRHTQKLESIGQLAGGIAHDFNNLLTGILGYASLLRSQTTEGGMVHEAAQTIEQAAGRAAELTGQLLGFARKGKHQVVPVSVHAAVDEVVGLLSRTLDKRIRIETRLDAECDTVLGDPGQLQQVLLNLGVNAGQAMPDGGRLGIETDLVDTETLDTETAPAAWPGRYVRVTVRDTGAGMPIDVLDRIFEPFFTTRERGQGTGMGLAMVYGIVENHGGAIDVHSRLGRGSTFRVHLPAAGASPPEPAPAEPNGPTHSTGRILLVDDEPTVRDVACAALRRLGYEVEAVDDGAAALDAYREHGESIDLVILDMVMPGMDGQACFRGLRELDPHARVILSSGYARDGRAQEIIDEGMIGFVQKPYRIEQLGAAVAQILAAK